MLQWLSDWLRGIIAIILFAGIADLLLPNKTMQRYVRLVAGLIILLTIMTPLLQFFRSDFETKLSEGIQNWSEGEAKSKIKMPSIEEIAAEGQHLAAEQQQQAGNLAKAVLEKNMKVEIERQTGATVQSVELKLAGNTASDQRIDGVTIKLTSSSQSEDKKAEVPQQDDQQVGEVQPVSIGISVDPVPSQQSSNDSDPNNSGEKMTQAEQALAEQVKGVMVKEWSIDPKNVNIAWITNSR